MKIFVMADGSGSRWNHPSVEYKHLLPINDIPLIQRTENQLRMNNSDNVTVICPDFFPLVSPKVTLGYRDTEQKLLLDGILRTQTMWDADRTIILLGDVCYSNAAIASILDAKLSYALFGRLGANPVTGKQAPELFALSFLDQSREYLIKLMKECLKFGQSGKLWNLYRMEKRYSFIPISDYTDDTDSLQAYEQFWDKLQAAAIKDDKHE